MAKNNKNNNNQSIKIILVLAIALLAIYFLIFRKKQTNNNSSAVTGAILNDSTQNSSNENSTTTKEPVLELSSVNYTISPIRVPGTTNAFKYHLTALVNIDNQPQSGSLIISVDNKELRRVNFPLANNFYDISEYLAPDLLTHTLVVSIAGIENTKYSVSSNFKI